MRATRVIHSVNWESVLLLLFIPGAMVAPQCSAVLAELDIPLIEPIRREGLTAIPQRVYLGNEPGSPGWGRPIILWRAHSPLDDVNLVTFTLASTISRFSCCCSWAEWLRQGSSSIERYSDCFARPTTILRIKQQNQKWMYEGSTKVAATGVSLNQGM